MNPLLQAVYEVQEATLMTVRAFRRAVSKPYYFREIITQMDTIGVGSLMIITLTGAFTGGILALNTAPTLKTFGATSVTGQLVMTSLVREMGPVLSALMTAGRVGSAIAAELGSMVVSEQVDAMRALGTDPVKKLVWPRLFALLLMTPALTLVADIVGAFGGFLVGTTLMHISSTVNPGETKIVMGGSGTGKSTILKLTLGLIRPQQGRILVDGEDIVGLKEAQMIEVRQKVGMVFQEGALFDSLSVYENVGYRLFE